MGRKHSKGGAYNQIEDEESGHGRRRLKGVEEVDEPVGYDLSGLEGTPMKKFQVTTSAADAMQQERNANEAGYALEFERLEAKLGSGLDSVTEVPFSPTNDGAVERRHRRGPSTGAEASAAVQEAQEKAQETGNIVVQVVEGKWSLPCGIIKTSKDHAETPMMDLDQYAGGDFSDSRSIMTTGGGDGPKKSYYFPPDPDMPAWRPFSMGWPWLGFLVVVSLLLAALQEALCQISMRRARESKNGGLISFTKPTELTVLEYFTWKYAPVLFLVIYGICWQVTDFEVKRLEPFYQLSRKTGATAAESLNMDYLTFLSWLVPLRALRHKQYAVIYVSLATLISSSLVPVLQSASVNVYPPRKERREDEPKSIRIDPPWSRAVTASLIFVAIFGSVLMYEMRRKSGLLSDPKGIAGIATMATKSHILTDFRGLDTAPLGKIHKQLRHRRYILHKSSLWQGEYITNSKEKIPEHGVDPRPLMLRLRAGIPYVAFIICFTISIPIFMFVEGANKVTEALPFLMTALATMIKIIWSTLNCDIRMLEPFLILSRRHAPAKTLTLDYTGTNPIFLPIKALMNRHYMVCIVGVGSILAEVLTVCVSSLSVDGKRFLPGHGKDDDADDKDGMDTSRANIDETFRSFWISFSLVMGILFVLVSIACLVYSRRSHKFMPRQIGTIASILAFIHQSKMLVDFVDTERLDSGKMTKHLERKGKTYALGWFGGRDGDDHLGIDEEPILHDYVYGKDWTSSRVKPNQIGTWEHYETVR